MTKSVDSKTKIMAAGGLALALSMAVPQAAHAEAGDFLVRFRAIAAIPDEDANLPIPGEIDIDAGFSPEIDFTYFITNNIGVELIAASTPHDVAVINTGGAEIDLGSVRLLPPTLTAQWHFFPDEGVRPYIGAGINYTWFFDEDIPAGDIDYEDSFGWVLQAGVDFDVSEDIFINFDVKKLFLDTEVDVGNGAVIAEVDINPLIIGAGFGFRF